MRLTTEEKATCSKYRKRDITGHVHCNECPLVISRRDALCKRTVTKKEWEEMERSYGGCTLSLCVVEEDNPEANPISCDDCPYYDPYLYKPEVKHESIRTDSKEVIGGD